MRTEGVAVMVFYQVDVRSRFPCGGVGQELRGLLPLLKAPPDSKPVVWVAVSSFCSDAAHPHGGRSGMRSDFW